MTQLKAVIDLFEEKSAVLLVGESQQRMVVPRRSLPAEAKEGHWLTVEIDNDTIVSAVIDEAETSNARQRIADKLARLRRGAHIE
ncbi:MAG: DUF3006 domain-containing protein [Dehalococcoidia bacterium]